MGWGARHILGIGTRVLLSSILSRKHRIPSELRSQATLGVVSTKVGDRLGSPCDDSLFIFTIHPLFATCHCFKIILQCFLPVSHHNFYPPSLHIFLQSIKYNQMKQSSIKIPQIFYGTAWKKQKTAELVQLALKLGFRGIDTACQPKHYNEKGVGQGIQRSGIPRQQLFIQTKFTSYDGQDPNNIPYDPKSDLTTQVKKSLEVSLHNLKTTYIDSLVLHSPMKTLEKTMEVWKVFQEFVKEGKVHYLGVSNCYDPKLFKAIHGQAHVKPSFLQNRFYSDSGYDVQLRNFCNSNNILYQSFWTLTANPHILESPLFSHLQKKYHKTSAQLLYRALTQVKIIPLIGTTSAEHMKQDLSIFQFELSKEDLGAVMKEFQ